MGREAMAFVLMLFPVLLASQISEKAVIDSMLTQEYRGLSSEGRFEEAIALSIKQVQRAEEIGYRRGVALGNIQIGTALISLGRYGESLRYFSLAQNMDAVNSDPNLKIRTLSGIGRNYVQLQMSEKALDKFLEALRVSQKSGTRTEGALTSLYTNIAASYSSIDKDSSMVYLRRAIEVDPHPISYTSMAHHYLFYNKDVDSASYYLSQASKLNETNPPTMYVKSILLLNYGNLYKVKGEYEKALDYYGRSLVISQNIKRPRETLKSLRFISDTYKLMGESGKSLAYQERYLVLNDSINTIKNDGLNLAIGQLLVEQEKKHRSNQKLFYWIIGGIVLASLLVLSLLFRYYEKKRRHRLELLDKQERIIQQKEMERRELEGRINEAFHEVVELATKNSPYFLARFQEVYPEVCKKLLEINPNLVNTELTLCAMIWLNFTSKEIARYTFVQPKTVQVKKYRLRKKLGIAEKVDLYHWMSSL